MTLNEHKPKMNAVMSELLQEFEGERRTNGELCEYCESEYSYNDYRTTIAGNRITFCSEWCTINGEMEMRRNWMRAIQQVNANKKIEE